ncbi:MAG: hypothetical protein WC815_03260 [Vicinamibacterales bacterium]
MNPHELADAVEEYRAGLETGVTLLRQLRNIASRQREGTEQRDYERLAADSDARDRLTRALVAVEPGLRAVRARLAAVRVDLTTIAGFAEVLALRLTAAELVAGILDTDRESMKALADAELARRAAVASLECGETTLAAYRRVLSPPITGASLLDRRG